MKLKFLWRQSLFYHIKTAWRRTIPLEQLSLELPSMFYTLFLPQFSGESTEWESIEVRYVIFVNLSGNIKAN
jgi:hypothetical protein